MKVFYLTAFMILLSLPVRAESLLCDALNDAASYEDKSAYLYLIEGREGFIFRTYKSFKEDFAISPQTRADFVELTSALKERGTDLVVVMPPTRPMVHADKLPGTIAHLDKPYDPHKAWANYNQFNADLKNAGVPVTDFSALNVPHTNFFYRRDHHWQPEGARLSALYTAELIKTLPVYSNLPRQAFTSRQKEMIEYSGTFEAFTEKVCASNIEDELVTPYETFAQDQIASDEVLFGAKKLPHTVLIGTSNTTEPTPSYANFAGFLRAALSTDIYNVSLSGAGIEAPIASYFRSDDFRDGEPKIIIWEIPSYYDLDGSPFDNIFNEAIAAAYGSCFGSALYEGEFNDGKIDFEDAIDVHNGAYILITLNEEAKDGFKLRFYDEINEKSLHKFRVSKKAPPATRFSTRVHDLQGGQLDKIRLEGLPEAAFPLQIQICRSPLQSP